MADLFDEQESESRKESGIRLASSNREELLAIARMIAYELAKKYGQVHADMVFRVMHDKYGIQSIGNASGAIFRTKDFVFTGNWYKSKRVTNHARMIRIWKLKDGYQTCQR